MEVVELQYNFKPLKYKNIKEDMYLINEFGDVYSLYKNTLMKPTLDKDGYYKICLRTKDNKSNTITIHRLVMYNFNGEPPKTMIDPTVEHIDENNKNNHYTNLIWLERKENVSGRNFKPKGELNSSSKLTENDVKEICKIIKQGKLQLKEIAELYGVSNHCISKINNGKSWTYITNKYLFTKRGELVDESN